MRHRFFLLLLCTLCGLALADSTAPASAAGLKAADASKLKKLGVKIVIPTYLPAGFTLKSLQVEPKGNYGKSYTLEYSGAGQQSFRVLMCTEGYGGTPPGDQEQSFTNPLFGKARLNWSAATRSFPNSIFVTDWVSQVRGKTPVYRVDGKDVSPEEAIKIAESLRLLK